MRTIFSIVIWLYWSLCIIVFFLIITITYLFTFYIDGYNTISNKLLKLLGKMMLKVNPGWIFDILEGGTGKILKPMIVVVNYQSFLDLPMLYLLPWSVKFVAKKGLFKIPVLG